MLETAPPLVFPKRPAAPKALDWPRLCFSVGGFGCPHPPLQVERRAHGAVVPWLESPRFCFPLSLIHPRYLAGFLIPKQLITRSWDMAWPLCFPQAAASIAWLEEEGYSIFCCGNSFVVVTSCGCPPEDLIGVIVVGQLGPIVSALFVPFRALRVLEIFFFYFFET